jgi:hypothetical protein
VEWPRGAGSGIWWDLMEWQRIWRSNPERGGNSPHSITGRVISLKVFANHFIHTALGLTTVDLLRKVARPNPKLPPRQVLTQDECD